MTLDLRLPLIGAFDVPAVWGSPWHGYVQGDALTLPNAATRTHPQPSGSYHWEYSAAHLLQVPGVPAVTRDTAEAAADTAAGREWRNYALLSGSTAQLYGQPLGRGRWIYVDPAGDRWLIDASALDLKTWSPSTVPASVSISVRRFGVVGLSANATSYNVSVPDLGQAGTPVYSNSSTETGFFDSSLYSLHPQGSAAVFMLHYQCADAAWPAQRFPCGWFELRISGAGSNPTLSVVRLHDRLETLGGAGSVSSSLTPGQHYSMWQKLTVDFTGSITPPSCVGTRTVTYDVVLLSEWNGDLGYNDQWRYTLGERGVGFGTSGTATIAKSYAGMVLAVWYDQSGTRQTLTLDMAYNFDSVRTGSGGGSSSQSVTEYVSAYNGTSCEWVLDSDTPYSLTLTMSETASESILYTMRLNGAQIAQHGASYAGSASATVEFAGSNEIEETWEYSGDSSHALTGTAVAGMPSPGATINSASTSAGLQSPDYVAGNVGIQMDPESDQPGRRALNLIARAINAHWADPYTLITVRPARIGQGAVGWLRRIETDGGGVAFELVGSLITPAGAVSAPSWGSAGAAVPSTPLHVAVQPVSGAVRVAAQPVCWA